MGIGLTLLLLDGPFLEERSGLCLMVFVLLVGVVDRDDDGLDTLLWLVEPLAIGLLVLTGGILSGDRDFVEDSLEINW